MKLWYKLQPWVQSTIIVFGSLFFAVGLISATAATQGLAMGIFLLLCVLGAAWYGVYYQMRKLKNKRDNTSLRGY